EEGLPPAVDSLADRSTVLVRVKSDLTARLPGLVEVMVYFVICESLANVAKHARASGVHVTITTRDGFLRLEVGDDGIGGAAPGSGWGLRGLQDRVSAVGGTL